MTGGVFTLCPQSTSPLRAVTPSYSVDSFSEYSTRVVARGVLTPPAATLKAGSEAPAFRERHEDEELFRDLFAAELGVDSAPTRASTQHAGATFVPVKPISRPAGGSTNHTRPHLMSMRLTPSQQPTLSAPVPRLNLEELLNARPDYDNNAEASEQVDDEDDDECDAEEGGTFDPETTSRDSQPLTNGFNSRLGFGGAKPKLGDNSKLEQETLTFLEKLDLKAVLHTPRPDLLDFYPSAAGSPSPAAIQASIGGALPQASGNKSTRVETLRDARAEALEPEWLSPVKDKAYTGSRKPRKEAGIAPMASRLAHMEAMYGTTPNAPRKARRETIDRLAHPFSGHTSTLQALSSEQRQRRESGVTGGALMSPIAVGLNDRVTSPQPGKIGPVGVSDRLDLTPRNSYSVSTKTPAQVQRRSSKRRDPLVQRRRPAPPSSNHVNPRKLTTQRRGDHNILPATRTTQPLKTRKEVQKRRLQSQSNGRQRRVEHRSQPIGGGTFLTQYTDEGDAETPFDLSDRHRTAARSALAFLTPKRSLPQRPTFSQMPRASKLDKTRPRPPQMGSSMTFSRTPIAANKESKTSSASASRPLELPRNSTERRVSKPRRGSGSSTGNTRLGQTAGQPSRQPRRPQVQQSTSKVTTRATGVRIASRRVDAKVNSTPCATGSSTKILKTQRSAAAAAKTTSSSISASLLLGLNPLTSAPVASTKTRAGRIARRGSGQSLHAVVGRAASSSDHGRNGRAAIGPAVRTNVSIPQKRRSTIAELSAPPLIQPRAQRPSLPAIVLPLQPDVVAQPRRGFSGRRIRARVVTRS